MANTKISALAAASVANPANELLINEAGTTKKLTVALVQDYVLKRGVGATIVAGAYLTWLVLDADTATITGVTLTDVMAISSVGVGRYKFYCQLIYQTNSTSFGIDLAVNHTGTVTQFVAEARFASTGQLASTGAATEAGNNAAQLTYESMGTRTLNGLIGSGPLSIDATSADMMITIEGFIVVSGSGGLRIRMAAESAGNICWAKQGSFLELEKLS